ncbi:DUF5682 family protein [Lachnoanaerobaculum umeaense]|uniref:Uncharacterized protein n=1 Tax=Lachnoanaerobaculum umeaense TaxID=617123 RepID=A0A385Q198_9FIRM|nr:DUF5682 family protein [Lachnoanaerobaculum umeaense]AYB00139.1 hypothetical protein D4A81_09430 [Lachnoanaerobaculum umeaense]PZW94707.1 hypothetical protein C7439_12047 [Lachnoanaerobaculum umeaense]
MKTFGIRHFSPAGAYFLRQFLDEIKPALVLIEGPADFDFLIDDIVSKKLVPPFAIMAYTKEAPIDTILYPFAEYSPEYQAILWAMENNKECHFFDLESDIILGLDKKNDDIQEEEIISETNSKKSIKIDMEGFWERNLEQSEDMQGYRSGSALFGESLRKDTNSDDKSFIRDIVRESFMKRKIKEYIEKGFDTEKIVAITGAFHTSAIESLEGAMSDKEYKELVRRESNVTLMPYSYYRLSKRTGYGAGNAAPSYYELLWQGFLNGDTTYHERKYLSTLAKYMREHGGIVSSAQVIEATRLARELAIIRGGSVPTLEDLKDASITCIGGGSFGDMAMGFAETDIGKKIGSVPQDAMQTSIQSDFTSKLKQLKLEKYKELVATPLQLDLRENLRVKSKESAFLDLNRSFFLYRLVVLGIDFAQIKRSNQDNATWAENWILQWTPEAEIQIVESVLKGDTIADAVAFVLSERLLEATKISEIAEVIEAAFNCGLPKIVEGAKRSLDEMANGTISIHDIAGTVSKLSNMISFGDIRKLDREPLVPIVKRLCIRAALMLVGESTCDDIAAATLADDIQKIHNVFMVQDFLDESLWIDKLMELSNRDDLNTKISGLATAILLDVGKIDEPTLRKEVSRRLSIGMPAELGANWFAGLSMRNHYALIGRLTLWESLSEYLDTLDEEEFRRSVVFLRRAFVEYSAKEKDMIAENLGEIWGLNAQAVSEIINSEIKEVDTEILEDFDFGDF